jgi:hypothetical protein
MAAVVARSKPEEVAAFLAAFSELRQAASTGDEARRLITLAAEGLA